MKELTDKMKKTLMQVGYGITCREDGGDKAAFFDLDGARVDMRSLNALADRGLVYGFMWGGSPSVSVVRVTEEGSNLFEELRRRSGA